MKGFTEVESKVGARHSQRDQRALQDIHDAAITLGAACPVQPAGGDTITFPLEFPLEKALVYFGGEVKALGDGKVGGYLVSFGDERQPDLTGDYFTKDTDFGEFEQADVYYQHGMDRKVGKRKLTRSYSSLIVSNNRIFRTNQKIPAFPPFKNTAHFHNCDNCRMCSFLPFPRKSGRVSSRCSMRRAWCFLSAARRCSAPEAYLRPFHTQSALDYVASGAWRQQKEFQRFIEARTKVWSYARLSGGFTALKTEFW